MYLISPLGKYDGFLLKEVDSIYKVTTGDLYLGKLLKLMKIAQTEVCNMTFESDDLVKELLMFAKENNKITAIEVIDSGYDDCIGFVNSIDEKCVVQEIDNFGNSDGVSTVKLSDITQIACDDADDRPLAVLHGINSR